MKSRQLVILIVAVSATLISSLLTEQVNNYEKLVDMVLQQVTTECPADVWQIKLVKRAVSRTTD